MKASTMESSTLLHESCIWPLQYFKSFAYKTAIPADEQAAASDRVAVTCNGSGSFKLYNGDRERERMRENNIKREHFFHEVANHETHTRDLGCEL